MENATITPERSGSFVARPSGALARARLSIPTIALVALALGALIAFFVYPTYPNYDSYYSLLWGRELLHGQTPSFDAYRAPTEHPLAILFSLVIGLIGEHADRVMIFMTFASFIAMAAGMYRLGRTAFGPVVGMIGAALLCTRFDFPFLAARGYIDIPYLALVLWAAVLEAERPRRGYPVLGLLALAAMMRPEAWLIIGLYFLWIAYPADNPTRLRYLVLSGVGPFVWVALDTIVTGHPTFSLTHTSGLAEELGRTKSLSQVPSATVNFLKDLDKTPVFYAGIVGAFAAAWMAPRRIWMPLALLIIGIGTFFAVGIAGLSVINRYLLVPSLMLMIFAGVTLGGWSMLKPSRLRTGWMVVSVLVVVYGVVFTATRVNLHVFQNELTFRGASHNALVKTLHDPAVAAGRRCGPVSTPDHKLIPDSRWILGASADVDAVVARSDPANAARARRSGVAEVTTARSSTLRNALSDSTDEVGDAVVPDGFAGPYGVSKLYSVYTRCDQRAGR